VSWHVHIDGLRLESPNVTRNEAWGKRKRTVDSQREWVFTKVMSVVGVNRPALPLVITIVRIGRGTMDDDNLAGSAKAVRDSVALYLGVKDNDKRLTWRYAQEKSRGYGVRVELEQKYE